MTLERRAFIAAALAAAAFGRAAAKTSGRTLAAGPLILVLDGATNPDAEAAFERALAGQGAAVERHIRPAGALFDLVRLGAELRAVRAGALVAALEPANHVLLLEALRDLGGAVTFEGRRNGLALLTARLGPG